MKRLLFMLTVSAAALAADPKSREGFVSLADVEPTIVQEMRYFTTHNFLGRKVKGYQAGKCWLSQPAATQLSQVQADLKPYFLSLKVYDCYRPQTAVNDFIAWAKDLKDVKTKGEFYVKVDKSVLFKEGYIAEKSGHSRGSTVDLTVIPIPAPPQPAYQDGQKLVPCTSEKRFKDNTLDMGTGYDCFDSLSHTENPSVGKQQLRNRLILKAVMEKNGFKNYEKEWWHFTLNNEPYPDTYFDFAVE